jgi:histidinol-phosphate aminotransferase
MLPMRPNIEAMAAYVPGFQPRDGQHWIKLNTNENPYPPSPKVVEAILHELGMNGDSLRQYPDPPSQAAREAAARLYGVDPSWVMIANGSDEVLNCLIRAFAGEGEELAMIQPSYSYYATLAAIQGARVRMFNLDANWQIEGLPARYNGKIFFLTSPNAPLGITFTKATIADLAARCDGILVVDEAYADFAQENAIDLVEQFDNVVISRTLSKSYALAGMRIGLAIARPEVIAALDKIRDHYNLDRLAQAAAVAALEDQPYFRGCIEQICNTRDWFSAALKKLHYGVLPSQGNFVFVIPPDRDGRRIYDELYARRILVRYFGDGLLAHGLRISIGSRDEMETALQAIREIG